MSESARVGEISVTNSYVRRRNSAQHCSAMTKIKLSRDRAAACQDD